MQLIQHGPNITDELWQAHEDGEVVFFCGAGISYPAKLPGFKELIDNIFEQLHETKDTNEKTAYERLEYSKVIELLEKRIIGNRQTVRKAIYDILQFDPNIPDATKTHEALLKLAKYKGKTKLITTNFDRIFEHVIKEKRHNVENSIAPVMPIPNNDWDAVVYLHGLLPETNSPKELGKLVLSTGDFGLAYLYRAWAASFIAEIFRNYHVCFIGYSINDVVLSYMVDAIAAAKLMGENTPEIFAFADFNSGNKDKIANEWKLKNVTPILYNRKNNHHLLHQTLHDWANIYSKGVQGKNNIIIENAHRKLNKNSEKDNFIGRILWALSDNSTVPLKTFSELNPVPSLDWLEFLAKYYDNLDELFQKFSYWLSRHLNNQKLLLWFIDTQGGELHDKTAYWIDWQLQEIERLENANQQAELNQIKQHAPNAIPDNAMRTLWQLMLAGYFERRGFIDDSNIPYDEFQTNNIPAYWRDKIIQILRPRLTTSLSWSKSDNSEDAQTTRHITDIVHIDVVLSQDAKSLYDTIMAHSNKQHILSALFPDINHLLMHIVTLQYEVGKKDSRHDLVYDNSINYLPSISEHSQNDVLADSNNNWVILLKLARNGWLAIKDANPKQAKRIAEQWMESNYNAFKRLAFFAATHDDIISPKLALKWLLSEDGFWLYYAVIRREAIRLVVAIAPKLEAEQLLRLENAILQSEQALKEKWDIDDSEERQLTIDRHLWLYLKKIERAKGKLSETAQSKLNKLSEKYSDWFFEENEKEEFPIWQSGVYNVTKAIYFNEQNTDVNNIMQMLQKRPDENVRTAGEFRTHGDNWTDYCQEQPKIAIKALLLLLKDNLFLEQRWETALNSFCANADLQKTSWEELSSTLNEFGSEDLQKIIKGLTHWLAAVAKIIPADDDKKFLQLCQQIIDLHDTSSSIDADYLTRAINHPYGRIAQALISFWLRKTRQANELIDDAIKPLFTQLCNTEHPEYIYARVIFARSIIAFFQVDKQWTKEYLLPLLNWEHPSQEAIAIWQGFLYAPQLHLTLLETIKVSFLQTASQLDTISEGQFISEDLARNYVYLLTYLTCNYLTERLDTSYTKDDFRDAFATLPSRNLEDAILALRDDIKTIKKDKKPVFWQNRTEKFLTEIFPNEIDKLTSKIIHNLAILCIETDSAFDVAFARLEPYFKERQNLESDSSDNILFYMYCQKLDEYKIAQQFPEKVLRFLCLNSLPNSYAAKELRNILNDAIKQDSQLASTKDYSNLDRMARGRGA